MHALRYLEKFLIAAELAKNSKNMPKWAHSSTHATSETKHSTNVKIGQNTAHGVRMMHELFVFKL